MLLEYLALAMAYWFITPRIGISLALGFYLLSVAASRTGWNGGAPLKALHFTAILRPSSEQAAQ